MNKKYRSLSARIAFFLQGMISLVTLMAVQAATGTTGIDETMPSTIPEEIKADWEAQDQTAGHSTPAQYYEDIKLIAGKLAPGYALQLKNDSTQATYFKACHLRRASRFKNYSGALQNLLYSRHHDLGGASVGYLEEMQNDPFTTGMGRFGTTGSVSGGGYAPGGALMLLSFQNCYPAPTVLLSDSIGCMRDPCVSLSGNKVVFAWSKDNKGYHIYEMIIGKPDSIRQLTDNPPGLTVSDFDPCYLPNGDILFNSSRCFGATPVGFTITSNLFIMNKDGNYLRRIGFDMANTFSPSLTADPNNPSIMYSRWEFNDRNQYNCLGLFQMNLDGTHQTELYGNQSTWPGAIYQGRNIPSGGTGKILAIIGGYSGSTANGDLALINTLVSRNSPGAVKLVAPVRSNPTVFDAISSIADTNRHFQNPYPLDESWFLISYRKNVSTDKFKIYLMNLIGERELLAWDSKQSVSQQQPLNQTSYKVTAYLSNWTISTASVKLLNPYFGMGMDTSVKKGMIKKIRVVGLDYPTEPSFGDVGGDNGTVVTPVSRWGGTLYAKRIIGERACATDGSANFYVPPRTPMYFQLIDSNGCLIQTMRSYVTLQPGEKWECYGCHENKNEAPVLIRPLALNTVPIDSFYGMRNAPLHFPRDIQPILTAKCAPCHITSDSGGLSLAGDTVWTGNLSDPVNKNACRFWCKSYLNLTDSARNLVNVIPANGPAEGLKPFACGSGKSTLISRLRAGMHGATLTEGEMAKLCAWIDLGIPHGGKYNDDMLPADSMKYETRLNRRHIHEALEDRNIAAFIADSQYAYYSGIEDRNPAVRSPLKKSVLKARYFMAGRRLLVKVPCEGTLSLVDLRGRRMLTATISGRDFLSRPEMSFPLRAPAGLYILKFKGTTLSAEKAIPIL